MLCADVGIAQLLERAVDRDHDDALDCGTDDEQPGNASDDGRDGYEGDRCASRPETRGRNSLRETSPGLVDPHPLGSGPSTAPSGRLTYAQGTPPKRGRSPSPAAPPRKSKHARKHKTARFARAEERERDGHVPRPRVINCRVESGTSIKTSLNSEALPTSQRTVPTPVLPNRMGRPTLTRWGSRGPWNGM